MVLALSSTRSLRGKSAQASLFCLILTHCSHKFSDEKMEWLPNMIEGEL